MEEGGGYGPPSKSPYEKSSTAKHFDSRSIRRRRPDPPNLNITTEAPPNPSSLNVQLDLGEGTSEPEAARAKQGSDDVSMEDLLSRSKEMGRREV